MPSQRRSAAPNGDVEDRAPARPLRVLLVDQEPQVYQSLAECASRRQMHVVQVASLADARRHLAQSGVDLALIDLEQPDGNGLALARDLSRRAGQTQTIVMSGRSTIERTIEAMRAGANDFMIKPLDRAELLERLDQARRRHQDCLRRRRRVQRLRRVCRKLTQMRNDVKQQVDILCQDLVAAYQDLAEQMNHVVQVSEFAGLMRQELDLEQLLRKTLEFLLQKAGPTNAAVFLPSDSEEFSVGGYVNYDCTSDSAEILLEHLANVVAPRVAQQDEMIHITDSHTLSAWIGQDVALLDNNHLVAFQCSPENETLAVIVLFRDASEPFEANLVEMCGAIAPMMGDCLARLIRIHHRHLEPDDDQDDEGYMWGSAA